MANLEKFFDRWRSKQSPGPLVHIRPDHFAAITAIAAQDQLPVGAVVHDLLSYALAERRLSSASLEMWQGLTRREKEVAALVWFGLTNRQIGGRLVISVNTVRAHVRSILAKFDVHSKAELRHVLINLDFSDWIELLSPDA